MKLTEKQMAEIVRKLSEFDMQLCTVCQNDEWDINPTIFELREFQEFSTVVYGPSFLGGRSVLPVLSLMCKTCGNTLLLNAKQLGLFETDDE